MPSRGRLAKSEGVPFVKGSEMARRKRRLRPWSEIGEHIKDHQLGERHSLRAMRGHRGGGKTAKRRRGQSGSNGGQIWILEEMETRAKLVVTWIDIAISDSIRK